jgi:Ser/Thr protein kinase RdoA (MazF antagonist)
VYLKQHLSKNQHPKYKLKIHMRHSIKHVKEEVNIALKRYNQQIIFQDTRCYNLFLSLKKKTVVLTLILINFSMALSNLLMSNLINIYE